jgi:hypothetical protein
MSLEVCSNLVSIFKDSIQGSEMEWEIVIKAKLKYTKENDKDVYRVQQVSNSVCCLLVDDFSLMLKNCFTDYTSSFSLL